MATITVSRDIAAPVDRVFAMFTDIEHGHEHGLLADDDRQSAEAEDLLIKAPDGSLSLSALTVAEVTWVLIAHFETPREVVTSAIQRVLALPSIRANDTLLDTSTRNTPNTQLATTNTLNTHNPHNTCNTQTTSNTRNTCNTRNTQTRPTRHG